MSEGPGERVAKDAFVMPELPSSLGIDPVVAALLHTTAFFELSGDGAIDSDWAVEAMEHVGSYLGRLSAKRVESLSEQLNRVAAHTEAAGWGEEAVAFFGAFIENFGLVEADDETNT